MADLGKKKSTEPSWSGDSAASIAPTLLMSQSFAANRSMLVQRVGYGALAIAALLTLVLLDVRIAQFADERLTGLMGDLLSRGSVLPVALMLILLLATAEFCRLLHAMGARPYDWFAMVMVVAMAASPWLAAAGWLGRGASQVWELYWPILLMLVSIGGTGVAVVLRGSPEGSLRDFAATLTVVLYIGFLGSFAFQLRCVPNVPNQNGAWVLLCTLLIIKCSDIGGFFVGVFIGRHRFVPQISPKKTIEGVIGGALGSVAAAVGLTLVGLTVDTGGASELQAETHSFLAGVAALLYDATWSLTASVNDGGPTPLVRATLLGLLLSLAGQIGDLLESCFKRDAGAKDSGSLIPRFGGILDLIDSPLFALPLAWFLMTVWWRVL